MSCSAVRLILALCAGGLCSCDALCLPEGFDASSRAFIKNSTGHNVPITLHEGAWKTSELFNQLMKILIEEGLGYHAQIDSVIGQNGASPIYALAGCTDFDDPDLRECGKQESAVHISIESWIGSYWAQFEEMRKTLPLFAALDLGSLGYEGEESIYVTKHVLDAAYNDSGLALDYYKSYDPRYHTPNRYLGRLDEVPSKDLKPCNSTDFSNPGRMKQYEVHSGDVEGVRQVSEGAVAHCFDGYWWAGPACRDNVSQCFPIITTGNGWKLQAIMQWVAAYRFPAAVGIHQDWANHLNQVRSLFYWWVPDSTFINLEPKEVTFPRHSATEWARGNKRTGAAGSYIAKMVSRGFPVQSHKATEFIKQMSFELPEVEALLLQMTKEPTYDVVCRWVKENEARWKEWVPVQTQCLEGFGLVDASGLYVATRAEASGCNLCPAGTASQALLDETGQTYRCEACRAGYHQPLTFSTDCEPCPRGTRSRIAGSTVCEPCLVSSYQDLAASKECTACEQGRTTMLMGAISKEHCVCQEGSIDQDGECVRCGEGLQCPVGSTMDKLQQNNISDPTSPRVVVGYVSSKAKPLEAYRCRSGCPGGAPGTCSGGLVGLTCGECPASFYKASEECHPCRGTVSPHLFWIAPVLYVIGVCAAYYGMNQRYEAKATAAFCFASILAVALSLFQNLGVLGTIPLDWPASSSPILQLAQYFLLDLEDLGANCVTPGSALRYQATGGIFLGAVLIIPSIGALSQLPWLRRRGMSWELHKSVNIVGGLFQAAFTTMASVGLMPFMCYEHPNGQASLLKHSNVFCGSAEQGSMAAVGVAILTCVGAFFCFYVYGVCTAPSCSGSARLIMWKFVLHRFKPSAWWFGLVILGRGTLISVPAVVATNAPSVLITLMLCVQQMYLALLLSYLPWKAPVLNLADGAVTGMLVVLLALSLEGLDQSSVTDILRNLVTFSIVLTLLLMFLGLLVVMVLERFGKASYTVLHLNSQQPKASKLVENFLEMAQSLTKDGSADRLEDVLQSLCYYDYTQVVRSLNVLTDEMELEVTMSGFARRVTSKGRVLTREFTNNPLANGEAGTCKKEEAKEANEVPIANGEAGTCKKEEAKEANEVPIVSDSPSTASADNDTSWWPDEKDVVKEVL